MPKALLSRPLALVFALLSFTRTPPAHAADDVVRACVDAHTEGQIQRTAGHLLAAKQRFLACSQPTCPLVVRKECVTFGEQLAAETPSVVLVATDRHGHDVPIESAVIDASWSVDKDFGMALELDPGTHELVLKAIDGRALQKTFLVRAGEHLRRIVLEFEDAPPSAPAPAPLQRETPVATYVVGGLGLLALGSFIGFALDGKSQEHKLDQCAPHCTQEGVSRMRRSYLIADISLALAVAAVGVDTYLIVKAPSSSDSAFAIGAAGRF